MRDKKPTRYPLPLERMETRRDLGRRGRRGGQQLGGASPRLFPNCCCCGSGTGNRGGWLPLSGLHCSSTGHPRPSKGFKGKFRPIGRAGGRHPPPGRGGPPGRLPLLLLFPPGLASPPPGAVGLCVSVRARRAGEERRPFPTPPPLFNPPLPLLFPQVRSSRRSWRRRGSSEGRGQVRAATDPGFPPSRGPACRLGVVVPPPRTGAC